jgi:hypothetical protein
MNDVEFPRRQIYREGKGTGEIARFRALVEEPGAPYQGPGIPKQGVLELHRKARKGVGKADPQGIRLILRRTPESGETWEGGFPRRMAVGMFRPQVYAQGGQSAAVGLDHPKGRRPEIRSASGRILLVEDILLVFIIHRGRVFPHALVPKPDEAGKVLGFGEPWAPVDIAQQTRGV